MDGGQDAARCGGPPKTGQPVPLESTRALAPSTLRQLLDPAAEYSYGVPAFNINNMEQGLAILEAADAVDAPVIIQASRGARTYANDIVLKHLIDALAEMHPHIPI